MREARFGTCQNHACDVCSPCCSQCTRSFIERGTGGHHVIHEHDALTSHRKHAIRCYPEGISHMVQTLFARCAYLMGAVAAALQGVCVGFIGG